MSGEFAEYELLHIEKVKYVKTEMKDRMLKRQVVISVVSIFSGVFRREFSNLYYILKAVLSTRG